VVAFGGGINYIIEKLSLNENVVKTFENPTGFVSKYVGGEVPKELRIYADLKFEEKPAFSVDVSDPMEAFSLTYTDEHASVYIGKLVITSPAEVKMSFRRYLGRISIGSGAISFSGTAGQVKYGDSYISQEKSIRVKGSDITYTTATFLELPHTSLSLENITGNITLTDGEDRMLYVARNTKIALDSFSGKIILTPDSIRLDGTGVLKTKMLLAPGK